MASRVFGVLHRGADGGGFPQIVGTASVTVGSRGSIGCMTLTVEEAARLPIVTDAEVQERVSRLIGRACRRQLWMLLIDDRAVQLPTLIPLEDYPPAPGAEFPEQLAATLRRIMAETDAVQVVFVWERCLGEAAVPADRLWARAVDAACRAEGVPIRAQLISHRRGVRWFAPDDFA